MFRVFSCSIASAMAVNAVFFKTWPPGKLRNVFSHFLSIFMLTFEQFKNKLSSVQLSSVVSSCRRAKQVLGMFTVNRVEFAGSNRLALHL